MKSTKYSNYNTNQQVLTQLLGHLMRSDGNSANGYGRGGGGAARYRGSVVRPVGIRRTATRNRRRPVVKSQAIAATKKTQVGGGVRKTATHTSATQTAAKSNVANSISATSSSTAQKRSAPESTAAPEKKKAALAEIPKSGDAKENQMPAEDPYMRGLCESGVRWYLRYLKEGLEPKTACKKAWEQRTDPSDYEPEWGAEFVPREIEDDSKIRSRVRRKSTKQIEVDEDHRIAVHPRDFPDQMLDLDQLVSLEDAITMEVAKGADVKLQFGSINLRPGALLVECVNEETMNWLKEIVPKLSNWVGPALTTSQERSIPDAYVMTVALPKSLGQEFERTLTLVAAQNEDLNTEVWKLVNEREENEKQVVTIRVDKDSFNTLKRNEWKLYYRFERVNVHFHRYLRYGKPILWITNPSCHNQNQVKPPGPANTK